MDDSFHFYHHNGDRELAESLGLTDWQKTWEWRDGGWIYLGTITSPTEEDPSCNVPGWAIEVEVVALPAQFWRFTVSNSREVQVDGEWTYEPQTFRFSTGSGGLGEFLQVATMFANNVLGLPELVTA